MVGLRSIKTNYKGGSTSLLKEPILTYIDSTVPEIWLPEDACALFEKTFGLVYNDTFKGYSVNDTLHSTLLKANPNVTFTIGDDVSGGDTVDIVLPYQAFALQAKWPRTALNTRYYPLRRAANDTQYTLGRAFLQEAYLFVDWERSTFTVSQCVWNESTNQQNLVNIASPVSSNSTTSNSSSDPPSSSSSNGTTIGIAVGVTLGVVLIIAIILFFFLRRRRHRRRHERQQRDEDEKKAAALAAASAPTQFNKPELGTGLGNAIYEAPGTEPSNLDSMPVTPRLGSTSELSGSNAPLHSELPASHGQHLAVPPKELHGAPVAAPVELEGSTPGNAELDGTPAGTPLIHGQDAAAGFSPGVSPLRSEDVSPMRSEDNSPLFTAQRNRVAPGGVNPDASPLSLPIEHPSPLTSAGGETPRRRPGPPTRFSTVDSLPSPLPSPLPRDLVPQSGQEEK